MQRRMTPPITPDDTRFIVDLDQLFLEWAKESFNEHYRRDLERELKTKLRWKELQKKLNYTNFFIDTEKYDFKRLNPGKPTHHVVFKTTYSNTTSSPLEYTLNIERSTRNVTSFRLSNSLTSSNNIGLKIKLPGEICELEGGHSQEMAMENEQEISREEEMTWSANTVVKVPSKTDTTLELVVEEQEYDGTFECLALISGEVIIDVYKGETEVANIIAQNFNDILKKEGFEYDKVTKKVSYKIRGSCLCRRGMNQNIRLSETKH